MISETVITHQNVILQQNVKIVVDICCSHQIDDVQNVINLQHNFIKCSHMICV